MQSSLLSLERTIAKVTGQNGEDTQTKMETPLNEAALWEVIGGYPTIKSFGHSFPGREYVLAKTWIKARSLARTLTGIDTIQVTHPDFSGIL